MRCKTIYIPTTANKGLMFLFGPGLISISHIEAEINFQKKKIEKIH